MEEEDGDNYTLTSADHKRLSATTSLDFRRFNAMRGFDNLRLCNAVNGISNSHLMSREDYALLIKDSIRDDLSEALEKKNMETEYESENRKRKTDTEKMDREGEWGECESEKKKKGCDGESSNKPSDKNKLCVDLTLDGPSEIVDDKVKHFVETMKWLREIYYELGPDGAEAAANARYEAEEAAEAKALYEAKEAAEAAAKALNEAKEAATKAVNEAEEAAKAAATMLNEAQEAAEAATKALNDALLV